MKIVFLLCLCLFTLFNLNAINSFFSQDDFFHLRTIMNKKVSDIPSFYITRLEGQTFYRPLSRESYNLVSFKLFGLNPLPYHLINVLLILINLGLIIIFLSLFTRKVLPILLMLPLFLLSSIHNIELYYLSSVQILLSSAFILSSIISFVLFLRSKLKVYILFSLLFYCIALLSHESAIILPVILFFLNFLVFKLTIRKNVVYILMFVILAIIYLFSISTLFDLPKQEVYRPTFNLNNIFNSLVWYISWSFGLPEILTDFVSSKFLIKKEFISWYGEYAKITFPLIFVYVGMILLHLLIYFKSFIKNRLLLFFIFSFFISISPFLFFPQHKFIYYLGLPIVFFCAGLSLILSIIWKGKGFNKTMVLVILFSFSFVSLQTINLNSLTHWAAKRPKAAKSLLDQFENSYPNPKKGSKFYILDDPSYPAISKEWGTSSKQAFYILSGSDAVQLLYKDTNMKVFYQAFNNFPQLVSKDLLYLVARFPY